MWPLCRLGGPWSIRGTLNLAVDGFVARLDRLSSKNAPDNHSDRRNEGNASNDKNRDENFGRRFVVGGGLSRAAEDGAEEGLRTVAVRCKANDVTGSVVKGPRVGRLRHSVSNDGFVLRRGDGSRELEAGRGGRERKRAGVADEQGAVCGRHALSE